MLHGHPLSASLPEDMGLGERFWYWRGISGQSYIHSIYSPGHCPPVAGAVFVIVRKSAGGRHAISVGRFGSDGLMSQGFSAADEDCEIHVHLLAREPETAGRVMRDLEAALGLPATAAAEPRLYRKPVQLDLLAA